MLYMTTVTAMCTTKLLRRKCRGKVNFSCDFSLLGTSQICAGDFRGSHSVRCDMTTRAHEVVLKGITGSDDMFVLRHLTLLIPIPFRGIAPLALLT